jgi:hypothetical protein
MMKTGSSALMFRKGHVPATAQSDLSQMKISFETISRLTDRDPQTACEAVLPAAERRGAMTKRNEPRALAQKELSLPFALLIWVLMTLLMWLLIMLLIIMLMGWLIAT